MPPKKATSNGTRPKSSDKEQTVTMNMTDLQKLVTQMVTNSTQGIPSTAPVTNTQPPPPPPAPAPAPAPPPPTFHSQPVPTPLQRNAPTVVIPDTDDDDDYEDEDDDEQPKKKKRLECKAAQSLGYQDAQRFNPNGGRAWSSPDSMRQDTADLKGSLAGYFRDSHISDLERHTQYAVLRIKLEEAISSQDPTLLQHVSDNLRVLVGARLAALFSAPNSQGTTQSVAADDAARTKKYAVTAVATKNKNWDTIVHTESNNNNWMGNSSKRRQWKRTGKKDSGSFSRKPGGGKGPG